MSCYSSKLAQDWTILLKEIILHKLRTYGPRWLWLTVLHSSSAGLFEALKNTAKTISRVLDGSGLLRTSHHDCQARTFSYWVYRFWLSFLLSMSFPSCGEICLLSPTYIPWMQAVGNFTGRYCHSNAWHWLCKDPAIHLHNSAGNLSSCMHRSCSIKVVSMPQLELRLAYDRVLLPWSADQSF